MVTKYTEPNQNKCIEGYIFCHDDDTRVPDVLFARASAGDEVGSGLNQPPYIVVDFNLSKIIVRWPGRLWRAQVLSLATDQPRSGWHYVRATSVRIIEELPISLLFGEYGQAVVEVLSRAHNELSIAHKNTLRALNIDLKNNSTLYSAVIDRWLQAGQEALYHVGGDHQHTLAISTKKGNSPVNMALSVAYDIVRKCAQSLEGDAAFVSDEDEDEPEMILHPDWSAVCSVLLHAVMAVGTTDELISSEERLLLFAPYTQIFLSS